MFQHYVVKNKLIGRWRSSPCRQLSLMKAVAPNSQSQRTCSSRHRRFSSVVHTNPAESASALGVRHKINVSGDHPDDVDVVVVGAGCAGVACATALATEGYRVQLLEQDPKHLGGRARSWPCPDTNHPMHIGPHIVYSDYPNYFKLIKLLDPEGKERIVWQRKKDVFTTINGTRNYDPAESDGNSKTFHSWPIALVNSAWVPPPLNWIPAVLRDPYVPSIKDALSLVPFGAFCMQLRSNNMIIDTLLRRKRSTKEFSSVGMEGVRGLNADLRIWQRLDKISGQELLDAFGVSQHYQKHVMAFVANSIINVPLHEVSGAALVSFFRKLVGRPGVRLGFTDGGLGTVLEPVEGFLARKYQGEASHTESSESPVGLRMGAKVTAVRRISVPGQIKVESGEHVIDETSPSAKLEVEMVDAASGQVSVVRPRHGVVVTLPPLETLKLLPQEDRDKPLDRLLANALRAQNSQQSESIGEDTPASVLSRFKPCKYVSVYLWFDQDVRISSATDQANAASNAARTVFSGHQFWAKKYDPEDFCCEFYDYSKIYTRHGTTPSQVLDQLGVDSLDKNSDRTACVSMIGVNMIDVDRLDPPGSSEDSNGHSTEYDPVCSHPAPLSEPSARHLAAAAWTDEQLIDRAFQELRESIGESLFNKSAKLLKGAVHRIPMAIPRMVVGTEMRRPVAGELHAGSGVYLAGDYCQTGFMNCMEGATQAGFECADEVLGNLESGYGAKAGNAGGNMKRSIGRSETENVDASNKAAESHHRAVIDNGRAPGSGFEDTAMPRRWALPHPEISRFAHLVSRYLVWPLSKRLWSKQLSKAGEILRA